MKNKKTIIYLHGYNSSGHTGAMLKRLLEHKYNVITPRLSQNADEAVKEARRAVKEYDADLVIGTSLGGFVGLNVYSPFKIILNPTLEPSKSLPIIGCSKEISDTYEKYEKEFVNNIDDEERLLTFGMFGTDDKVVNYKKQFMHLFLPKHVYEIPGGEHQVKEKEFIKYVFPLIEKIFNKDSKLFESYFMYR